MIIVREHPSCSPENSSLVLERLSTNSDTFTIAHNIPASEARICGIPQQLAFGEVFYAIVNSDNESLSVQERLDQEWTAEEA